MHTRLPTDIILGYDSFIKTYKPTKTEMAESFERIAAMVNGSKGEFSRHRDWTPELNPNNEPLLIQ